MPLLLFIKGILLGLIITAPPGPIGTLCINRTLERGFWGGATIGIGTALGDSTYAVVALAGLSIVADTISAYAIPLTIGGGIILMWLGYRNLRAGPAEAAEIASEGLVRISIATYVLTISNPATLLSFGALFAGFGLAEVEGAVDIAMVIVGVLIGSLTWWFGLSGVVTLAREKLSKDTIGKVSKASSYLLIVFGAAAIGGVVYVLAG